MVAILFVFLIITRKPYFFLRKFYFFWNHTHFTMMKIHPLNHKNKISLKTPRILSLKVNLGKYGSNWTLKLLKQIRHLVFHWIYKILWNRFYFFDSGWELELHVWAHSTEPSLIAVSCSWNNIFEWHEFLWYIQHSVVSTIKKKNNPQGFSYFVIFTIAVIKICLRGTYEQRMEISFWLLIPVVRRISKH